MATPINSPWKDEARVAQLKAMWAEGQSCTDIGAALGVSRNAVIGRIHRMGLSEPLVKKPAKPKREKRSSNNHHTTITRISFANANNKSVRVRETIMAAEQVELRCVEIVPMRVGLMDLADKGCRYPYDGTGDEPSYVFCNHPQIAGSSYCGPHHAITWVAPRSPERPARKFFGTDFAKRGVAA